MWVLKRATVDFATSFARWSQSSAYLQESRNRARTWGFQPWHPRLLGLNNVSNDDHRRTSFQWRTRSLTLKQLDTIDNKHHQPRGGINSSDSCTERWSWNCPGHACGGSRSTPCWGRWTLSWGCRWQCIVSDGASNKWWGFFLIWYDVNGARSRWF